LVATSDVTALQRSDLNAFLFADVGTEHSGMMLSVVSLFARQGSDPWREADRLAELPKEVAADSLARSIAEMPQGRWNPPDAAVIAARLIGLLPKRPAGVAARSLGGATSWLPSFPSLHAMPSARNAIVLACVALGIVYAVSAMLRPAPTPDGGGDVSTFSVPAPGSNGPQTGRPQTGRPQTSRP
jgi:hypothetical protein